MKRITLFIFLYLTGNSMFAQSLFQRYSGNPVFNIGSNQPTWRSLHVANVTILPPSKTPDGKWRLWLRGSGNNPDGYHDNIGMFDQNASSINPYGPWQEYSNNPNLPHGPFGSYDALHVLDAAAMEGPNDEIYLYYMGRDANNVASLSGAVSTDGGFSFNKFSNNPLKTDVGPNDAVYANGQYYVFYGDAKWNGSGFDEPLQIWLSRTGSPNSISTNPTYAIQVGPAGSFDSYSVNGGKIFKVSGDSRWFMIYQTSSQHFDYPDRFHCAYSDDLVNWTKVNNNTPLMQRGNAGTWDQGGIWTGSVIEHNGKLHIYYEGWGSYDNAPSRDIPYYAGGNSRVGVASVSTGDFLNWVNGGGGGNQVNNGSFEVDGFSTQTPSGWSTWPGNSGADADADYTETGSYSGTYRGTHYKARNYEVYTTQTINGLANGTYSLSAWVVGGGGQDAAFMSAKNYGSGVPELKENIPQSGWPNWSKITIPDINVTHGSCTIGFYSNAYGGQWLSFDQVELVQITSLANSSSVNLPPSSARMSSSNQLPKNAQNQVKVFPNPVRNVLNIQNLNKYERLIITDMMGRKVRQMIIKENNLNIDMSDVKSGIYMLHLKGKGAYKSLRIVR